MKYIYTGKEAQKIDAHAIKTVGIPSLVLMENAATAVAKLIMEREDKTTRILAVCGTGNNGGDGIAVCRILHEKGYDTSITVVGEPDHMTGDTRKQLEIASACYVPVIPLTKVEYDDFDIVLDAIFGVGLSRNVEGIYKDTILDINHSDVYVYAIDIPSGVHAGTGDIMNVAVHADVTVTFGVDKIGLVMYPGCEYAGEVYVADIGFPTVSVSNVSPTAYVYEPSDCERYLPMRPARSHKGTFGKVLVVAGSETMSGACYLAAKAAYTAGAGLVKVVSYEGNRDILLSSLPEILFSTREEISEGVEWADAIVIGPGLGLTHESLCLVQYVLDNSPVPTVIDGDGIRLCSQITHVLTDNFILTPHVREMSYLTGKSVTCLKDNMIDSTMDTARALGCILAHKDARTIVSDGNECYINVSGNNGMATGGSGDVLSGLIGGLLAQGMDPFPAAKLGVYLHGLAGDQAVPHKGYYSLMASDLIDGLSEVLSMHGRSLYKPKNGELYEEI